MTDDARLRLTWTARDAPLPPRAVAGWGPAARALGRRLAALDEAALVALTAVAGDDVLVLLGDAHALPWIDGVVYLGRDPAAPALLLPTALAPSVPPAVLEHALVRRLAGAAPLPPLAVLPAPLRVVACGGARMIQRDRLAAWLRGAA